MLNFDIESISDQLDHDIQKKIDEKTKPQGALGKLETLAFQIARVQQTLSPIILKPHILVFAADHGVAQNHMISAYPSDVTWKMVDNFLNHGAAINVLARTHGMGLSIIDSGVNHEFQTQSDLISEKIGYGTQDYIKGPAMSKQDCLKAIQVGQKLAKTQAKHGSNILCFGEMGIGNTSSASLITHIIAKTSLEHCVGKGTGLNTAQQKQKQKLLQNASDRYSASLPQNADQDHEAIIHLLSELGGFEIAMMCGAFIGAAQSGCIAVVDGFISSAAALCAITLSANVQDYCIFSHHSAEPGHQAILSHLKASPLLDLSLRLGEGTGAALIVPLMHSAVCLLNDMASFSSANVSNKSS